MRDLPGYVNTLDRRSQPAESGLYQHLIFAHEEFASKGMDSGICLLTLDEMNFAQVEHYFSGFLQGQKNHTLLSAGVDARPITRSFAT